jgi:hypothetical protein
MSGIEPAARPRRASTETVAGGDGYILRRGKARRRSGSRGLFEVEWEDGSDFAPYFSPGWILTEVANALLDHTRERILEGRTPDQGYPQPALEGHQAREARKGLRPNVRGHTGLANGNAFPDALKRTKVIETGRLVYIGNRRFGTSASTTIEPGLGLHKRWLADEAAGGVEFFSVKGDAESVIKAALVNVLDHAIIGPPKTEPSLAERRARDFKLARSKVRPRRSGT